MICLRVSNVCSFLNSSIFRVPASSATSERIFSCSDRILAKRMQSLKNDVVEWPFDD